MNAVTDSIPTVLLVVIIGAGTWFFFDKMTRNAKTAATSRAWLLQHHFTLFDADRMLRTSPQFPFTGYTAEVGAEGTLGSHRVMFMYGEAWFYSAAKPFIIFQAALPRPIPGTVLIRTLDASWTGDFQHIKMESTLFRNSIQVLSKPARLAHALLAPDFMAWYEDHHPHPVIYVAESTCCIVLQQFAQESSVEKLAQLVPDILRFVERSGALEPNPKTA